MHAATRRSLWLASGSRLSALAPPARFVAGRRHHAPRLARPLSTSRPVLLNVAPYSPGPPPPQSAGDEPVEAAKTGEEADVSPSLEEHVQRTSETSSPSRPSAKEPNRKHYGSAAKRSLRNRPPRETSQLAIPLDFLHNNVRRHDSAAPWNPSKLTLVDDGGQPWEEKVDPSGSDGGSKGVPESPKQQLWGKQIDSHYNLGASQMHEIMASLAAGLANAQDGIDGRASFPSQKLHLALLSPIDGGMQFLEKVVDKAADRLGADAIVLDAQSLSEIASDYLQEESDATINSLWTLGYDTAATSGRMNSSMSQDDDGSMDDMEEADEQEREPSMPFGPRVESHVIPLSEVPQELKDTIRNFIFRRNGMGKRAGSDGPSFFSPASGVKPDKSVFAPAEPSSTSDVKLGVLLDSLIGATKYKKGSVPLSAEERQALDEKDESKDDSKSTEKAEVSRPKLVVVEDFREMRATMQGSKLIAKLIDVVQRRRQSGQQIMIVGLSSSSTFAESFFGNADSIESLQSEDSVAFRNLVVIPETDRGLYARHEGMRNDSINRKHIISMLKRLDPRNASVYAASSQGQAPQLMEEMAQAQAEAERGLLFTDRVLTLDEVHRLVFIALGKKKLDGGGSVAGRDIINAFLLLQASDKAKTSWQQSEAKVQAPPDPTLPLSNADAFNNKLKMLRKTSSQHEKNLLRSVVNPDSITTTFADVHAEPDTIEALKTLTTLSLKRPDAFKYGVLKKDKINGLLLYGPPGTGKTLLAKAVAKESGATMLEVSGSDIYDMYVGEGEKNVRAVFSLAKKLAPCVVFIDEADAIFASRGGGNNRNSHRELINQFLREWDGMTETSAFIMVATNRPFDIDDAALRRLPRRLLIDLPTEKDRETILEIHLQEEQLAPDVSLSRLASRTPLYSGSDLKNIAVAAALAAVREENEDAARSEAAAQTARAAESAEAQPEAPYKFPDRRVLTAKHFEKALDEIGASVSDDMSSLGAIRKFDEKYGDKRGARRRKRSAYGFGPNAGTSEADALAEQRAREEAARVRS